MKKTIFFSVLAVLAAAAVSVSVYMKNENPMDELFSANVEALASGESEVGTKCGGCSTDKSIYCCTLVIVDVGTFYLYKD